MGNKKIINVLFICHGNICRSTMAEFLMKKITEDMGISDCFYIESAGSNVFEPDSPVYPETKNVLYNHNIRYKDIDKKRSRNITKDDYEKFDYILYAEYDNLRGIKRVVGDDIYNKMYPIMHFSSITSHIDKDIDDPWYSRNFEKSFADLYEGISGFIKYINRECAF